VGAEGRGRRRRRVEIKTAARADNIETTSTMPKQSSTKVHSSSVIGELFEFCKCSQSCVIYWSKVVVEILVEVGSKLGSWNSRNLCEVEFACCVKSKALQSEGCC